MIEADTQDSTIGDFNLHELARLFPDMTEEKQAILTESIQDIGQIEPITLTVDGELLDGRHRLRACQELGIEPLTKVYPGNPLDYVLAKNADRRDLKTEQRALIAAEISADSTVGRPSNLSKVKQLTQTEAAKRLDVSRQYVNEASHILASGEEDLIAGLRNGEMRVKEATNRLDERRKAQEGEPAEDRVYDDGSTPEVITDEGEAGEFELTDSDGDAPAEPEQAVAFIGSGVSKWLAGIRSGRIRVRRHDINSLRRQFDEVITELEQRAVD